jgi:hypothetical protein
VSLARLRLLALTILREATVEPSGHSPTERTAEKEYDGQLTILDRFR